MQQIQGHFVISQPLKHTDVLSTVKFTLLRQISCKCCYLIICFTARYQFLKWNKCNNKILTVKKFKRWLVTLNKQITCIFFLTSCIRFVFFNSNLRSSGNNTHCTANHHLALMETKLYQMSNRSAQFYSKVRYSAAKQQPNVTLLKFLLCNEFQFHHYTILSFPLSKNQLFRNP